MTLDFIFVLSALPKPSDSIEPRVNPASLGSVPTPNQSPNPVTDWAGTFPHGTVEMQGLLSLIVPWQYQFPEWKTELLPTLWPHGDKQDIHKLPVTREKLMQWVQTEVERRLLEERETIPYPGFWPSSNSLVCNSPTPMMSQGLQCLEELQGFCAGSSIQSRSLTTLIFVQYQTTDGLTETFEIFSSLREKFKNWSTDKDKAKQSFSRVWLFATLWTVAHQAPQSTEFSSKNIGVGCHFLCLSC